MARWRDWDIECLDSTFAARLSDNEEEPLIIVGSSREIPQVHLSSIVLPKEAFFSNSDSGNRDGSAGTRSKGRGRALVNRALGFDKPIRRPGERDNLEKVGASPKARPTLGSQFFGSEYLHEELFPPLGQASSREADLKPKIATDSVWSSKEKLRKEKLNQISEPLGKKTTELERSFEEKSRDHGNKSLSDVVLTVVVSDNDRDNDPVKSPFSSDTDSCQKVEKDNKHTIKLSETSPNNDLSSSEVKNKVPRISSCSESDSSLEWTMTESNEGDDEVQSEELNEVPDNVRYEECQHLTCPTEDHFQDNDWIESVDDDKDKEELPQLCNNEADILDEVSTSSGNEIVCDNLKQVETSDSSDKENTEYNNTDFSCDKQGPTNVNLSPLQGSNTSWTQLKEDKTVDDVTSSDFDTSKDDEPEQHTETNDVKEYLDSSQDLSASEETEPCNVLLENLPLALTEEELQDIVEPYGEMASFKFQEEDETKKRCVVKMANCMCGELLVVSLDGLEVDGYRMKATMVDN